MATKVIKFNDGTNTYVPVTVASAVQYSYNGGVMSVQDALGTVVSAVIPAAGHFGATVNLTYSDGAGLGLSGVHSDSTKKVKIDAGDGINIEGINGGIKISNTAKNQIQHFDVDGATNPSLRLDSGANGIVQLKGTAAAAGKAAVKVSYTSANGITIEATYTDTKPASADFTVEGNTGSHVVFNSNESSSKILSIKGNDGTPIRTFVDKDYYGHTNQKYVIISHETSGVTSGTYGTNSNTEISVAPGSSESIVVPEFTVNSYGHITATKNQTLTFDFSALTSAMHWIGVSTTDPKGASGATVGGHTKWIKGDVVSYNSKEYVLSGETNADVNWLELGDEGSHALKTISITGTDGLTGGGTISENRTISHAVPSGASAGTKNSAANNFIKSVTTDKFGHVTGYTTATFTQDHTKSGNISAGQLTYWNSATVHTAVTTSYGDSSTKYVYVDKGVLKEGTLPTGNKEGKNIVGPYSNTIDNTNTSPGGSIYFNHIEGGEVASSHKITGSSGISVNATDASTTGATISIAHSTGAGYKHIPAGGKVNQVLKYSYEGAAVWSSLSEGLKYDIYNSTDDFTLDLGASTATVSIAKTTF